MLVLGTAATRRLPRPAAPQLLYDGGGSSDGLRGNRAMRTGCLLPASSVRGQTSTLKARQRPYWGLPAWWRLAVR